jgi:hypothetical protein
MTEVSETALCDVILKRLDADTKPEDDQVRPCFAGTTGACRATFVRARLDTLTCKLTG